MISLNLDAQVEPGCGTVPSSDSLMETLPWYGNNEVLDSFISVGLKRVKDSLTLSVRSNSNACPEINELIFIPIQFFWVLAENESPPTSWQIKNVIDWINFFYQNNGLPFRFFSGCPLELRDEDHLVINNYTEAYFMYLGLHHNSAINVYVVDDIVDADGVYNPLGDFIYVTKDIFSDQGEASTLSHELGHFFGLEHTFRNYNHPDPFCYREPVSRTRNYNFLYCGWTKWGKMCASTGDCLCDTPADPSIFWDNSNCVFNRIQNDIWGSQFVPNARNIMSNTRSKSCRTILSEGQKGVIWHNLLTKHDKLLKIDEKNLNPDKYEPDHTPEIATLIKVDESQCHSMQNWCRDEVDYLWVEKKNFIGNYFFEIEDVIGSNNPVDEVKFFNRNSLGDDGSEIISIQSTQNGVRRFSIACTDITSNSGMNIEIKRNNREQGIYVARLTKSNNLIINNNDKECLVEDDVLNILNLLSGCTVSWSSTKNITFSNSGQGETVTILNLNGNTPPILINATVFQSNGCYEEISKEFKSLAGVNAPYFVIEEIEKPCRVHGVVFLEGYYETDPPVEVEWSVSDGSLFPGYGSSTIIKPDELGWLTVYATYDDGCSISRTEQRNVQIKNCDNNPKLSISPNPSDGNINVRISGVEDIINGSIITIIDGLANVRLTQSTNLDQTTIDVSSLNNGIYYLNWTGSSFNHSSILIIHK